MSALLKVLYEDNHLLVVDKPNNLLSQGAQADEESLVTLAKAYIKQKYQKPGNVYLGIVSRLDRTTSGVIVLARTSKAAARLNQQFAGRQVQKTYWALHQGTLPAAEGEFVDWLWHNDREHRVQVVSQNHRDAQQAVLRYRRLAQGSDYSFTEIELLTGRKHQIRVQLSSRGYPILGDQKYQGTNAGPYGAIGLHARRLVFEHPTLTQTVDLTAEVPTWWKSFLPR